MSKQQEIQELYGLLRSADAKAQAGDTQAQADAQGIYDHIQSLEAQANEQKAGEYPSVVAAGLGVGTKAVIGAGKRINEFSKAGQYAKEAMQAQKSQAEILAEILKDKKVQESIRGVTDPNGGTSWTKKLAGIAPPGSNMSKGSLQTAEDLKSIVARGGPLAGGSIHAESFAVPPDPKAEKAAQMEKMLRERSMMGKLGKYGSAISNTVGPVLNKAMPWMNAATLPLNAAETYNRYTGEDPIGAGISAIGTATGAASLYPPLTVPAGLVSLGAAGTNWARDEYLKRRGQPQMGNEQQPPQYATGGLVYLR
jgi:hypothetical protein